MLANVSAKEYKFQSTLPAGGATYEVFTALCKLLISIHAPRGGSDFNLTNKQAKVLDISIHAPRGGSDRNFEFYRTFAYGFQSTLPAGGATLRFFTRLCNWVLFQSTLPAGGATSSGTRCVPLVCISIHAPRGGSDWAGRRCRRSGLYFNPRSPRGERPFQWSQTSLFGTFQSTLPAGGATTGEVIKVASLYKFQSTLPAGGATAKTTKSLRKTCAGSRKC